MITFALDIFKSLFDAGSKALKKLRETATAPDKEKKLREWGISEAAEMIGRTSQTLRNLEETKKIPAARMKQKGKRAERIYNLNEINALRDHFKTRPSKSTAESTAILAVTNFKGGAGKTTSAINTAQYFAKKGYKVLFIDCDSQGSATQMFGFIPDEDFGESDTIFTALVSDDQDLNKVIRKTYWDSLDLIPANLSLYSAELMIPTEIANYAAQTGNQLPFYRRLSDSLKSVEKQYDIIILDCPPSMGMISINAIFAANALIVPVPPVIVDFASTIQFFKMLSEVMERLPKKAYSFIRILVTKYNGRVTAEQLKELLKAYFGQYVMSNNMIESEAISKAASNMQTLYEIDKFDGSKRTYERAIQQADRVNEEIESLIKIMWSMSVKEPTVDLEKDMVR